jgi:DNA-binding SARP family transcriptional activator
MEFRILGPLEVHDGGKALALRGARQRALLAFLLLHANEVVSTDRLIAELWGADEQVEDAAKALQVAVLRLRRALEPERSSGSASAVLLTRPPGYELRTGPCDLDADRFRDLAAAGRAALAAGLRDSAVEKLDAALALWRGAPLADLGYESFAQREINRLEELRLAVVEDRITASLELGRHADLVAELQELVGEHPLRERLREQLMLALYRCGRQADALDVYRDARSVLTEELGIEPGRGLRDLQEAILRQDPALDRRASAGEDARSSRGVFAGRRAELDELRQALARTLAGEARIVLVAGEPGIGKTRLAEELTAEVEALGARVVVGRSWEAGGAPPFWPWVQSLRAYVRETGRDALGEQLGTGGDDLARLLPELREEFPELAEQPAPESEGARFHLFEAVSAFLRRASEAVPLVIVLDDLHAADAPSLLLLRFVAREMAGSRVMIICAFRDVDPLPRQVLATTIAELVREPLATQMVLTGFDEDAVAEYISLATGVEAAPSLVAALQAETGGNPLFVEETVRLLEAEGRLGDADAHLRIPLGVRVVIEERLARLSEPCRRLLMPAAVLGQEFGIDTLTVMSGLPRGELLDVLDEAVATRVLGDVSGSPGRLRFGHALIRETVYESMTAGRRAELHLEAGNALEALYLLDPEPHLAELAHHFAEAAPAGDPDRALHYLRRAAERAASQHAYEEAVRLYEVARRLMGDSQAGCELLLELGDAQGRSGDTPGARESFRRAAELAERLDLREHAARAALGYGGRHLCGVVRGDPAYVPLLEGALAGLGGGEEMLRVKLLARLAGGPLRDARFPPARRRLSSAQALGSARRMDDAGTLAYALAGYNAANRSPDYTRRQVELSTELIAVAADAGDLERKADGHEHRASALIELGDVCGAKADLAAHAQLAKELAQPSQEWFAKVYDALVSLLEGDLATAETAMDEARAVGERAHGWNAAVSYGLQLYMLRREQGRLAEVEELVRRSAQEHPGYPVWRCVLAQVAAELGRDDEARAVIDELAAENFAAVPFDEEWLVSITLLAEAVATIGDADRAAELYALLAPYEDRVAVSCPEISTGPVARPLALLALITRRWDDAERHFTTALEIDDRIGARSWLERTKRDLARMPAARAGAA